MSSPSSPNDNGPSVDKDEPVTFKFCPECSNMLYPKEDKDARRLMYTCRTCQHTEEATSNCIYRNKLKNEVGETAGVTQDVTSDPTVGDAPPPSPSSNKKSALVICGCCGQVIMCSDCGLHPAVISPNDKHHDDDVPSSPPETYQEELLEQMIVDEDALNRMMNNIVDMAGLMELDEDMDDWEPENEPAIAGTELRSGPSELPRANRQCPKCGHNEAVFFQSQQRTRDTGMSREDLPNDATIPNSPRDLHDEDTIDCGGDASNDETPNPLCDLQRVNCGADASNDEKQ
ncbi:hypothetical protein KVR01_004751 [Diaporthe batatas]|uniref:DNA-directed RNA polymerase II core subunit RPB9 n=1 Tax=Diaporthe batatas TaxID=748121 RepID=UPI001D0391A5|nr:DNA-directed RNA polymerase II core subunit RPB9 [Diaporthe batatas]KAG8166199.1 hypothetical protein KVR01_004751 [Diaporthe batatas]